MPGSSAAREYTRPKPQYDFSRFEETPKNRSQEKKKKSDRLQVIETPARQRRSASRQKWTVNLLLMALVILPLASIMLYSRAVLATVNEDIGVKTEELNTLNGEYIRLQTELEAKISLKNIEEYASTNLGMVKVEQGQVEYVNLGKGDSVNLYSSSKENNLMGQIKQWISHILGHNGTDTEIG